MTTLKVQYTVDGSGNVVKSFRDIGQVVDKTTGEVRELTEAERALVDELDRAGARKRALAERMKELDDAYKKGIITQGEFRRGTVGAIKDFIGFDRILGVVAGAATVAAGAVVGITTAAINNAAQIDELSQRLSVSSETLSIWGYAAKMTGTTLETVAGLVPKLSKRIGEAQDETSEAGKIFKLFGIDVRDGVTGQLRTVEQLLPELSDAFKSLNNPVQEQALALKLFGQNGAEVLEFMRLGSDGFDQMAVRARALGIVLNDETTGKAAAFKDELENLKASTLGLGSQIAAQLLPSLTDATGRFAALTSSGQLAANITALLGGAVSSVIGAFELYNNTVARVQLGMEVIVGTGREMYNMYASLLSLDFSQFLKDLQAVGETRKGAIARLEEITNPNIPARPSGLFANVVSSSVSLSAKEQAEARERAEALDRLLKGGGGGGGGKGSGKQALTEEQREAERLARQYEALVAKQQERLAVLREELATGEQVGSAWKLAYDIQTGALAKLTAGQRLKLLLDEEQIEQLDRQQKAQEKLQRERDRAEERARDMLDSLREEIAVLGMTNDELEIYNNLKRAGADANSEFGRSIVEQTRVLQATRQIADSLDNLRAVGEDFLVNLPRDGAEAWKKLLADLEAMLLQWAAKGIIEQIFGQGGTTGAGTPGGDLFGGLFGRFLGGGGEGGNPFGGLFSSLLGMFGGGRADGGAVHGGKYGTFYDINERGLPEILRFGGRQLLMMPPGQSGVVTPTPGPTRGAFTQINHHHYAAPTERRTQDQLAARLAADANRALRRNS